MNKVCAKCNIELPFDRFCVVRVTERSRNINKDGRQSYCIDCKNAYRRSWYAKKKLETGQVPYREWLKAYNYKSKYNLTVEQAERMKARGCEICKGEGEVIDHCHVTNKVRGSLCHRCNKVLGLVKDNVDILTYMIKYLEK